MTANRGNLPSPLTRQWIELQASSGATWIGVLDDPQAFLVERGWQAFLPRPDNWAPTVAVGLSRSSQRRWRG